MASDPTFGTAPYAQCTTFTNGMGTRPRAIWTPGSNGSRVHFISQANSVSSNPTLYLAEEMTLQSTMGTGAHVDNGGSSDTLTRSTGSFITDGWLVGDRMWVSGSTTLANDYLVQVTAVASGTLTFATATVNAAENLPAGAKLFRMHQLATVSGPLTPATRPRLWQRTCWTWPWSPPSSRVPMWRSSCDRISARPATTSWRPRVLGAFYLAVRRDHLYGS